MFNLVFSIFCSWKGLSGHNWELFYADNNPSYISNQISIYNEHSSHHTDISITSVSGFKLVRRWDLQVFSKLVESVHIGVKTNKNSLNKYLSYGCGMLERQFSIISHKPAFSKAFFFKSQTCSWGHKVTNITPYFNDFFFHNAPGRPAAGAPIFWPFLIDY